MIEMGFEEGTTITDPGYQNVKNLFLKYIIYIFPCYICMSELKYMVSFITVLFIANEGRHVIIMV